MKIIDFEAPTQENETVWATKFVPMKFGINKGDPNFFGTMYPEILAAIEKKKVRVKHLDREDIESLGFTDYKHSAYDWYKFSKAIECPIANYNYCGARLLYDRSTSGIIIMGYEYQFELDEDKNAVNLFRGIIKNKSELVKLLKQLGY